MDKFYTSVLIGALVLLIIILVVVGVIMSKLHTTDLYPPTYATCPDYWDVSSNPSYCGFYLGSSTVRNQGDISMNSNNDQINLSNPNNIGLCNNAGKSGCKPSATLNTTYIPTSPGFTAGTNQFQYIQLNDNTSLTTNLYPGTTDRCAKKRWADTMGITWDGVTNFNGC